jgi:hypothetical protein
MRGWEKPRIQETDKRQRVSRGNSFFLLFLLLFFLLRFSLFVFHFGGVHSSGYVVPAGCGAFEHAVQHIRDAQASRIILYEMFLFAIAFKTTSPA